MVGQSITLIWKFSLMSTFCTGLYRNDRETRGGGVLIAANQNVPSRPFDHLSTYQRQSSMFQLTDPITIVCGVYVPPNSPQSYLDDVLTYINSLPKTRDIIILGDFNSPDIDWSLVQQALIYSRFL